MIPADLITDVRRFFVSQNSDTGRDRAVAAGDVRGIVKYLTPSADHDTGSRRAYAKQLIARLYATEPQQ